MWSAFVGAKTLPAGNAFWQNTTKKYDIAGRNDVFGKGNIQIEGAIRT